jgi:two-component system cell cycle sensor histidine kinase/response regulator CckA
VKGPDVSMRQTKSELLAEVEALKQERSQAEEAQRRAERSAQETEELLKAVMTYAPTPIHVTTPEGRYRLVNRAWENAFGLSREKVLGRLRTEVLPREAAEYFNTITLQVLQSGNTMTLEERSDIDVESRFYLGVKFPLRNSEGGIDAVGGISTDITELQRVERALRHSETHYRTLLDNLPDVITRIRRDLTYLYVSPAILKWTGRPAEDFIGRRVTDLEGEEASLAMWADLLEQVFLQAQSQEIDFTIDMPNGLRYFHMRLVPEIEEGQVQSVLTIARDMTELRRAEQERLDFERRILETQKLESLGVLAGGVAHDFNNLLMAILGNIELALTEMPPDTPGREAIARVETVGRRAADLTRQILAYSGKGKFVIERIDLNAMVAEMTDLLRVSIGKNVTLGCEFASNLPQVEGDASQLRQVAMNLLVNASDAIGNDTGLVTISTGSVCVDSDLLLPLSPGVELQAGKYVFLDVVDTGCGIDAEIIHRIFDPFFTTKFTGRGLGLAAALGIARGHRGAIQVQSRKGAGTKFRLLLPVCLQQPDTIPAPDTQGAPWRGAGKALVVDDEESVRSIMALLLEKIGFTPLVASDGRAALDLYQTHAEGIVCTLLDLTMPGMNGRETFLEIRRLRPDARVVLMSGYAEQDAASRFGETGLAGFLQKPFHTSSLRETMRRVLQT